MANRSYPTNLVLNIQHICAVKNIDRPFTFLRKAGFTHNTASMLANNQITSINLAHIERLCIIFNCTPNDLFDYKITQPVEQLKGNPLTAIIKNQQPVNFNELVRNLPLDKLKEIEEEIKKRKL